ncbi:hypothetical protein OKW49_005310 [Paraburkholderia youngii]|uniref:hypothetical protein n=1 Tax=Paraburkholderia youngii TaxID=2782701 RepID=UPI003D24A8AC
MPEPITTVGVSAVVAYLGKDGVAKLLGPTADYLGKGLQEFAQKRAETVGKIFQKAGAKLGEKMDRPGEVPPKVLREIIDEGSFANDDLAIEYLGGVLASSRTEAGRDDRGARLARQVNALSTYQLRAHYLIYGTVREIFASRGWSMNMHDRPKMRVFLPLDQFIEAMEFSQTELQQAEQLIRHIFFGLHTDELIEGGFQYGNAEQLKGSFPNAPSSGILCQPSASGAELLLWALGEADKPLEYLFDPAFVVVVDNTPSSIGLALAVNG